jgi:hypothetical protein
MGLFDDLPKGPISTILLGVGVAMVAPTILPSLAAGLRPLAKSLVKGGVTLYDAAKEGVAEAGEQLNDLIAESRAELAQEARKGESMESSGRHAGDSDREVTGRMSRRRAKS